MSNDDGDDIPVLRPRGGGAVKKNDDAANDEMEKAMKEQFIQSYAKQLEELKKKDPDEYRKIIRELQTAARAGKDGFNPKMPGSADTVMGSDGIESTNRPDSLEITPSPGFVVKTYDSATREKVFINVCHCPELAKPSMKKKLDSEGKEQEGLNIPLSLGDLRISEDKKKAKCSVYDVVVNSEVVAEAKADKSGSYRHFICQLAIQYLHQKHRRVLDQQYKLPRLKYKDPVSDKVTCHSQWIRKEQVARIEEVADDDESVSSKKRSTKSVVAPSTTKKKSTPASASRVPIVHFFVKMSASAKGDEKEKEIERPGGGGADDWPLIVSRNALPRILRVTIEMEGLDDASNVALDISSEYLVVDAPGFRRVERLLPYAVLQRRDDVATFDPATCVLTVELTVDPAGGSEALDHRKGPDVGSRPWLLARALREGAPAKEGSDGEAKRAELEAAGKSKEEFAEDRFLKNDVLSQHYIQQKEEARRTKAKRAAEDRKRRENDPNIEYIDDVTEWARKQREKDSSGAATKTSSVVESEPANETEEEGAKRSGNDDDFSATETVPGVSALSLKSTNTLSSASVSGESTNGSLEATHDLIFGLLD